MRCLNNCCHFLGRERKRTSGGAERSDTGEKVGIVLLSQGKVIIVQSNSRLWGFPKGGRDEGETEVACGIRELFEETGYVLSPNELYFNLKKVIRIGKAVYYVVKGETRDVKPASDATMAGWIKISCLCEMVKGGNIDVTAHTRTVIKRLWGVEIEEKEKFVIV